ncbi:hypothetical protein EX30DRAFT_181600 [Ascodesmis nigricans]|uniref:Uncharacterized protein n=1 Tax=Ascodesmis nigricans TaxID=341454 RepID=A0A4S2ML97_9PEZI|nr:hypothetical protein EX30DRAFT_181600 [Ascodesmis nigricans]
MFGNAAADAFHICHHQHHHQGKKKWISSDNRVRYSPNPPLPLPLPLTVPLSLFLSRLLNIRCPRDSRVLAGHPNGEAESTYEDMMLIPSILCSVATNSTLLNEWACSRHTHTLSLSHHPLPLALHHHPLLPSPSSSSPNFSSNPLSLAPSPPPSAVWPLARVGLPAATPSLCRSDTHHPVLSLAAATIVDTSPHIGVSLVSAT